MERNKFYGIFSKPKISNLVKTQETRPHQGFLACESLWLLRPFWIAIFSMFAVPFVAT